MKMFDQTIYGDYIKDEDGVLWKATGYWCRRCIKPLQSPIEIKSGLHSGCEVTD